MIRHCDGTDPNLRTADGQPCACGLRFDDVTWSVIYPHDPVGARLAADADGTIWWWPPPPPGQTIPDRAPVKVGQFAAGGEVILADVKRAIGRAIEDERARLREGDDHAAP